MQTDRWNYTRRSKWSSSLTPRKPTLPRPDHEFNILAAGLIAVCIVLILFRL
jgi:hypothetical protein